MRPNEKDFLSQVGIGWFSVRLRDGTIWRLARSVGGSHTGSQPYMKSIEARRAERSISRGHLKVWFTIGIRKRMHVYAHRIVWMVVNHSDIPEGLEINHVDGNPLNNNPGNLQVVTHQENGLHAGQMGVLGKHNQNGERNPYSRVTEEEVREIRRLCKLQTMPQTKIAELFGVKQGTISNIHVRKTWRHLKG